MLELGNKFLLKSFQALIYAKKGIFWVISGIGRGLEQLFGFAIKKGGFYFYQWVYKLIRKFGLKTAPVSIRVKEFFFSFSFLRVFLLLIVIFFVFTETRLYARPLEATPGGNSILLSMIGFSEDFFVEELPLKSIDVKSTPNAEYIESSAFVMIEGEAELPNISSISAGDNAFSKPLIITGSEVSGQRFEMIEYIIQDGDTISSIAQKFGISMQTILWENYLSFYSLIRPGQKIKILPVSGVSHKVKKGETLAKIAKLYKADSEEILKFNRLYDAESVKVGESLIIPGGVKIGAAPVTARTTALSRGSAGAVSPQSGSAKYIWPTAARRITQYFTWRHAGVDIAGPTGTAIYAARSGRVTKSACGWNGGYGCYIIIDHGDGMNTLYSHASKLFVKSGEYVEQGQNIAAIGSTGRSTGPHVHFEVKSGSRRLNPFQYIR